MAPMVIPTHSPTLVDVELEGEEAPTDPIANWQDHKAWSTFPKDFIPCPLSQDQLKQHYSLHSFAIKETKPPSSYHKEEESLEAYYLNPPITKHTNTTPQPHKRTRHQPMKPLSHETIETRWGVWGCMCKV